MKTTYSAYIANSKGKFLKIGCGFESSELAIKFCNENYPKLPFVINRDHVNGKGKTVKSGVIARFNPTEQF